MIEQGIAVGIGFDDGVGCDRAAGAALVLNDDLLAKLLAKPLCGNARGDVDAATGGKRHNQLQWMRRKVGLRLRCQRRECH